MDAFCIRYVVRTTKELRRKTDQRAEWKSAAHAALEIAQTIFFAVLAGLSGGGYGASTGVATSGASNTKESKGSMVAVCLSAAVAFSGILSAITFDEQPLQLTVSPQRVTLLYRLPWRNRSIPINRIARVDLVQYKDWDDSRSFHYNLLIYHDGKSIRILGNSAEWYSGQMKAAYDIIQAQLRSRKKQS